MDNDLAKDQFGFHRMTMEERKGKRYRVAAQTDPRTLRLVEVREGKGMWQGFCPMPPLFWNTLKTAMRQRGLPSLEGILIEWKPIFKPKNPNSQLGEWVVVKEEKESGQPV